MTLADLERTLPNGLHDAELDGFSVDLAAREAVLAVNIHVGGLEPTDDPPEGTYRSARLTFPGLQFFVVDVPDGDSGGRMGVSMIDSGVGQPSTAPIALPVIPDDCFLCWLFVYDWNSFIRIAARSVALEWMGSASNLSSRSTQS